MANYIYIKKEAKQPFLKDKKNRKKLSAALLSIGIFFFAFAAFPILQFQFEYSNTFNQVINPLSTKFYNTPGSILGEMTTDYSQLGNWFVDDKIDPKNSIKKLSSNEIITYKITIPKLKIEEADVTLGSMDLKKSLIQYPQTALPGQLGNTVIFGHSVLPQFFNAKSYLTIFATLFRLKPGDDVFIKYDNVQYNYRVEDMFEVKPTDMSVLDQRFDGRYMSIITCSPPGTYLRRLVVKLKLVEN